MHRSRTALAAALMTLALVLAGCSGDAGGVDVEPGNVEVTPPEVDLDAPDVDVDADVEESPSG